MTHQGDISSGVTKRLGRKGCPQVLQYGPWGALGRQDVPVGRLG